MDDGSLIIVAHDINSNSTAKSGERYPRSGFETSSGKNVGRIKSKQVKDQQSSTHYMENDFSDPQISLVDFMGIESTLNVYNT